MDYSSYLHAQNSNKRLRVEESRQSVADHVVELVLASRDRDGGSHSTCSNATFSLDTAITGVVSVDFGWFSFFNVLPNITSDKNTLGFNPTVGASVDVVFATGNWTMPSLPLDLATFLLDPTAGVNDIRYEIYRQVDAVNPGLVLSILPSPITGQLSITFDGAAGSVVPTVATNSNAWTGFDGSESGSSWTATSRLALTDPMSIAIACPEFMNHIVIKSGDYKQRRWMTVIPVTSQWGTLQVYEPNLTSEYNFTGLQMISRLTIQLVNSETGELLPFQANDKWELMLKLRVSRNL